MSANHSKDSKKEEISKSQKHEKEKDLKIKLKKEKKKKPEKKKDLKRHSSKKNEKKYHHKAKEVINYTDDVHNALHRLPIWVHQILEDTDDPFADDFDDITIP